MRRTFFGVAVTYLAGSRLVHPSPASRGFLGVPSIAVEGRSAAGLGGGGTDGDEGFLPNKRDGETLFACHIAHSTCNPHSSYSGCFYHAFIQPSALRMCDCASERFLRPQTLLDSAHVRGSVWQAAAGVFQTAGVLKCPRQSLERAGQLTDALLTSQDSKKLFCGRICLLNRLALLGSLTPSIHVS